ncbi:gamma-tubulin complex component 6 [Megachile rotundata]|uniref:gamma-tubulin complex component 6 n=1 Tax=Megachile rotundata TaxID=143995 RepID=UPI003FD190CC
MNDKEDDTSVYGLVTELSRHILQTYRSVYGNIPFSYEHDIKMVKHLRTKAFEILLKNSGYKDHEQVDPLVEAQKYAFVLKLELKHVNDANTLENLLQEVEEYSHSELQVLSTLQLLMQLKSYTTNPEPIINIFYYGKTNPAIPEITYTTNNVPPFQVYPMECFMSSDKFEATLKTERFQITPIMPSNTINEQHFLHDAPKSKAILGIESNISITPGFMSNHAFDTVSSQALLSPSGHFTINSESSLCILQDTVIEEQTEENENLMGTWKSSKYNNDDEPVITSDIWNSACNRVDLSDTSLDYQTWEYFGEIASPKEPMFVTDTLAAAIHLAKMNQTSSLPLLSEKIMNSVSLPEEVSAKDFINDLKLMLLGIESSSFQYKQVTGFTLRKNICVYGIYSESLEKTCQDAIKWGNCFMSLSQLTSKSESSKLQQEGLIFKAMCTSIKEVLLYYQAVLLRIFTCENKSETLLKLLRNVRSVASLITKLAKVCEPYKQHQNTHREGNGILTRIYNEAIKVTDSKLALVFYSLLKSCCEVYFRFLQKWIFEGICDDIYGEFMIKIRPQYLRNRGHKFWTKSFGVCNDAVPGFLTDLTESILQCGKTVRLLRTCDPKNPVCRVCTTEQPEVKVCLSVNTLREQLSRCREYERKGKSALGPVFSLSTAISNQKILEKNMSKVVVPAQNEPTCRIQEAGNILKTLEKDQISKSDSQQQEIEKESSDDTLLRTELDKQGNIIKENSQYDVERNSLIAAQKTDLLSHYENLNNDLDKRYMRSQWRAKRMTFFEKRIDALTLSRLESRNQLEIINESSGNETPIKDENKNYATTYQAFTSNLTFKPYVKEPTGPTTLKQFSVDCTDRSSEIERPTFLNILNINDATIVPDTNQKVLLGPLECTMTPNNNEVDVQRMKIALESKKDVYYVRDTNFDENNLETPMSCTTTDNSAWSAQSPVSQYSTLCNTEDSESPMEISNTVASNSSYTITKSPVTTKEDTTFPEIFGLTRMLKTPSVTFPSPSATAPLTVADVEIIDHTSLQSYLEKSIRIPLDIQSRLINNAIIKYFLKENNLLSHLHSLRSYFFLLNGEFAKSLTDSLYTRLYQISVPIELFNSATLTNLLERALVHSFNNVYINSELLSLSATDTPAQLHISDPTALDCLSLNYKISWPLNIILDETVMQQYSRIFKFLITSGRVSWVLQEDFNVMKGERKAMKSEQYHKLQLYRHAMTQFMNALHNYLTCSILHASWAEFELDLENSLTVDQIYLSHVNYIKRILSRCMLNSRGEKVRVCLNNIFKVILKFHNRLRSHNWVAKSSGYVHPNFKKLEQMYRAFCELRAYMAHVVFKLATSGYQPHLMHFLNALNINHLYDITVKTNRGSAAPSGH